MLVFFCCWNHLLCSLCTFNLHRKSTLLCSCSMLSRFCFWLLLKRDDSSIVAFVRFHFVEQTIFHQKSTFSPAMEGGSLHKQIFENGSWISCFVCVIFSLLLLPSWGLYISGEVWGRQNGGFKFACLSNWSKKGL